MGVSPWTWKQPQQKALKGRKVKRQTERPVVPLGLAFQRHDTPGSRPWLHVAATSWLSPAEVPTGRKDVAMGVSPWTQKATATKSPEGAKGKRHTERPVVPLGLAFPRSPYHGLTPVATCCRHFVAISARKVPTGRKDVAMGVSPWTQKATATKSPEGAKGKRHTERPVVPLGLAFPRSPYHGLTPVATCCRHFVAISARKVPTGRKDVAMGVSPWTQKATATKSPEGAKGKRHTERPVVPLGLAFPRSPYHGLTPVATSCRHFVAIAARKVPTGRKDVAMGASPWTRKATATEKP